MAIEFLCSVCNTKLRVDDQFAGRTACCPKCSMAMVIPSPDAASPASEPVEQPQPPQYDTQQEQPNVPQQEQSIDSTEEPPEPDNILYDFLSTDEAPAESPPELAPRETSPFADEPSQANDNLTNQAKPIIEEPPPQRSYWYNLFASICPVQCLSDAIIVAFLYLFQLTADSGISGIATLLLSGYLYAYMFAIIVESASGSDELPSFNLFSSFWEDFFRPLLLFITTRIYVYWPTFVVSVLLAGKMFLKTAADPSQLSDTMNFADLSILAITGITLFLIGTFFWPMVALAAALGDFASLLRPHLFVISIIKTFGPYLACCVCLWAASFVWYWAVFMANPDVAIQSLGSKVISTAILSAARLSINIYSMKVIGLLYRHYKHKLAWTFE